MEIQIEESFSAIHESRVNPNSVMKRNVGKMKFDGCPGSDQVPRKTIQAKEENQLTSRGEAFWNSLFDSDEDEHKKAVETYSKRLRTNHQRRDELGGKVGEDVTEGSEEQKSCINKKAEQLLQEPDEIDRMRNNSGTESHDNPTRKEELRIKKPMKDGNQSDVSKKSKKSKVEASLNKFDETTRWEKKNEEKKTFTVRTLRFQLPWY